jgi:adenine-specific DNA-methyltransferase
MESKKMTLTSPTSNGPRSLAAFYTPSSMAQLLTNWAVESPDDVILDPSFGGCAFLMAARDSLLALGTEKPERQLRGIDIDPAALTHLESLYRRGALGSQFQRSDFLDVPAPQNEENRVDCIVGNPPFLFHGIQVEARRVAFQRIAHRVPGLPLRSNQWAYFLLYSLEFLRHGGRLAMILPTALLQAEYAAGVRDALRSCFRSIHYIALQERVFEGTEEQVVILLADDYGTENQHIQLHHVKTIRDLQQKLETIDLNESVSSDQTPNTLWDHLEKRVRKLLSRNYDPTVMCNLNDFVDVRIGVVTGSNKNFLLTVEKAKNLGIPERFLKRILAKPATIAGIDYDHHDFEKYADSGQKSLLLSIPPMLTSEDGLFDPALNDNLPQNVLDYLETFQAALLETSHGSNRKVWFSVPLTFAPDGFFQYMSSNWPRLVGNSAGVTCTNNIHRLIWKQHPDTLTMKALALGSLSSLAWLQTELYGRTYGRGVLKLEPNGIKRLKIPVGTFDATFEQHIDAVLRMGDLLEANRLVDQRLLIEGLGWRTSELNAVRKACMTLHNRRRPL